MNLTCQPNWFHARFPKTHELPCTIEIGKANDSGTFLVLVIEAGDGAQRELSRYLGQLDRSGMSQLPNGANIGYTSTVLRR
jgi:hypothetical protein